MDRKRAFERVQLWLAMADCTKKSPSMSVAHKLANLVYNLTNGNEVYSTGFIYDVWCELLGFTKEGSDNE